MTNGDNSEYDRKVKELMMVIYIQKARLIKKYGPSIEKKWTPDDFDYSDEQKEIDEEDFNNRVARQRPEEEF